MATSYGYPMRYLQIEGISDCPVCQAAADRGGGGPGRRVPHEALRAIILEANPGVIARPGWHEVPDRAALIAGPDRIPQIV